MSFDMKLRKFNTKLDIFIEKIKTIHISIKSFKQKKLIDIKSLKLHIKVNINKNIYIKLHCGTKIKLWSVPWDSNIISNWYY